MRIMQIGQSTKSPSFGAITEAARKKREKEINTLYNSEAERNEQREALEETIEQHEQYKIINLDVFKDNYCLKNQESKEIEPFVTGRTFGEYAGYTKVIAEIVEKLDRKKIQKVINDIRTWRKSFYQPPGQEKLKEVLNRPFTI